VDIDSQLLRRVQAEAVEAGVSVEEALDRALRRGLDSPAPPDVPYECPTFAMGQPRRPLDQALVLADVLEDDEVARGLTSHG
jgi:hypothetical protein